MVGGLSGMAVNCQVTSLVGGAAHGRRPASLITKRRSSVPLARAFCAPDGGSASPPLADHVEVDAGRADDQRAAGRHRERAAAVCTGSPGRRPCRITGGRPV